MRFWLNWCRFLKSCVFDLTHAVLTHASFPRAKKKRTKQGPGVFLFLIYARNLRRTSAFAIVWVRTFLNLLWYASTHEQDTIWYASRFHDLQEHCAHLSWIKSIKSNKEISLTGQGPPIFIWKLGMPGHKILLVETLQKWSL